MSDIIYNTTAVPPAFYSFEDALSSATAYSIPSNTSKGLLELYPYGCITDRGILNCTEACQDVNQIFLSAQTLQNCIVFPQISSLLASGSLTKEARAIAIKAGIDEDSYNMSDTIFKTTTGCLQGWCHQINNCDRVHSKLERCYDDVYGKRYCFLDLCPYAAFLVNAEVGGIGVRLLVNAMQDRRLTHFLIRYTYHIGCKALLRWSSSLCSEYIRRGHTISL